MKRVKRFDDGGYLPDAVNPEEERLKQQGLSESKDDKVGFFERLRMGNIDQEGSEAYNRFGAGRIKSRLKDEETSKQEALARRPEENDVVKTPEEVAKPVPKPVAKAVEAAPVKQTKTLSPDAEAGNSRGSLGNYPRNTRTGATAAELNAYNGTKTGSGRGGQGGPTADELSEYQARKRYTNKPMDHEELLDQIPGKRGTTNNIEGNSASGSELGRNVSNTLNAMSGFAPARIAKSISVAAIDKAEKAAAAKKAREVVTTRDFWSRGPKGKRPAKMDKNEYDQWEKESKALGYKAGGSVKGWGKARSARSAKVI